MKKRIIVEIQGGVLQNVYTDLAENITVELLNWDIEESDVRDRMEKLNDETVDMNVIY